MTTSERFSLRMSARDLVNIGIFAALYTVITFAVTMLGIINPPMMLVATGLSIIAGGVPFMLFLTRVDHAGMITVFAVVAGAVYTLMGTLPIAYLLMVVLALVAEVVVWFGRYRSVIAGTVAYAVFSIWFFGPVMPLLYARDDYLNHPGMQSAGADYVAGVDALFSPTVVIAVAIGSAICGLIGGAFGARLLRRHFVPAGLA